MIDLNRVTQLSTPSPMPKNNMPRVLLPATNQKRSDKITLDMYLSNKPNNLDIISENSLVKHQESMSATLQSSVTNQVSRQQDLISADGNQDLKEIHDEMADGSNFLKSYD